MTQPPDPTAGAGDWQPSTTPAPTPDWPTPPVPGDWTAPGYAPPRHNGPGIASLFIGLLAIPAVLFLLPGAVLGVVALALGLIGRGRVKRGEAGAKAAATAGVVLGTVAIVGAIAWGVTIAVLDSRNQDAYEDCLRSGEAPSSCVERYDPTNP
ncbi:MAG TPA: hypothetical protein VNA20_13365 [Frankiaceae bacterium]|nr:hypothetical protein [Frankiaceae bacterium]